MENGEIISQFKWWAYIWVPIITMIVGVLATAFFTYIFGAQRAERRKEQNDLRDSLNFLSSMSLSVMNGFLLSKPFFLDLVKKIDALQYPTAEEAPQKLETFAVQVGMILQPFVVDNSFSYLNIEKYSQVITLRENFIIDILNIRRRIDILIQKIEQRRIENENFGKIITDLSKAGVYSAGFISFYIASERSRIINMTNDIDDIIVGLDKLISETMSLSKRKIEKQKTLDFILDEVKLSDPQKEQIRQIKASRS